MLAVDFTTMTLFGVSLPVVLVVAIGVGIYFFYLKKGGDPSHPLSPLTDDLDTTPPLTGRPTLDKVLVIAAEYFAHNPALLYLIHKEAEELAAILEPEEEVKK